MPIVNGEYVKRTRSEIREDHILNAEDALGGKTFGEYSILYAQFDTIARTAVETREEDLEELYNSAYLETASNENLTRKAREKGVVRRPAIKATGVIEFQRDSASTTEYVIPSGVRVSTSGTDSVDFETSESTTLSNGDTTARANIEAVEGGSDANVSEGSIVEMDSPPAGVETVTNPKPTGDPNYSGTSGEPFRAGRGREDDEELRERALSSTSIGGASTAPAIETALGNLDGVRDITLIRNKTFTDNRDSGGLPPISIEPVVYGEDDQTVAQTIHDNVAVTERLYGGAHGTKVSVDVQSSVLAGTRTVEFSRPAQVDLTVDLNVVIDGTYSGSEPLKERVVEYVESTDLGDNVIVAMLEDYVTGDEHGVKAVTDVTIDANGDGTDDTIVDDNGLDVISVGDAEVADVNADSITVTEADYTPN